LENNQASFYVEPNLAMVEIDRLLINATNSSETSSIVNSIVIGMVKDAAYPPIERMEPAQSPMMLGSHFHIIFLKCNAEADVGDIVEKFNDVLPDDILLTYEQQQCTEVQYGNLVTAEDKESHLYSTPSLFGLSTYTGTDKVPIVLVQSLDEFEIVTPFFAGMGQEESFSKGQVMELLANYFGLLEGNSPQSITNGAGDFDEIDASRLNLIFRLWRNDLSARDALLRIGLIKRLNLSLTYEGTGSLKFYPDFEEIYTSLVEDFKFGRYHDVLNTSKELTAILQSQGYWNSWADSVLQDIEEIEGGENCMRCGDGCYGFEGICCEDVFHLGGDCCNGDCIIGFSCLDNVCTLDLELVAFSLFNGMLLVVPPFALLLLVLFSHSRMKHWKIRKEYKKLKELGLKDDKAYFKLFQMGYKKKDLKGALSHVKRKRHKPKKNE
jgi:hypothetical protein